MIYIGYIIFHSSPNIVSVQISKLGSEIVHSNSFYKQHDAIAARKITNRVNLQPGGFRDIHPQLSAFLYFQFAAFYASRHVQTAINLQCSYLRILRNVLNSYLHYSTIDKDIPHRHWNRYFPTCFQVAFQHTQKIAVK